MKFTNWLEKMVKFILLYIIHTMIIQLFLYYFHQIVQCNKPLCDKLIYPVLQHFLWHIGTTMCCNNFGWNNYLKYKKRNFDVLSKGPLATNLTMKGLHSKCQSFFLYMSGSCFTQSYRILLSLTTYTGTHCRTIIYSTRFTGNLTV